jgi:tryptophan synthase beta chain
MGKIKIKMTDLKNFDSIRLVGEEPDVLIGCFGGGSNFGGFTLPFIP